MKHYLLFLSMMLLGVNAFADRIPGYIGSQSFNLKDDRDLANFLYQEDQAKIDYARIDQSRDQLQGQLNILSKQVTEIRTEMDQLNSQISADKQSLKSLQEKLAELQKNAEANKAEIDTTNLSIERMQTLIKNRTDAYAQLKLQLPPLTSRLDQVKLDFDQVSRRAEDARIRMLKIREDRERYERSLIAEIQRVNRDGANRGGYDGELDGNKLAADYGYQYGSRDGSQDGMSVGTRDGQERDYRRGADQGDRDGAARARIDGERDGTSLGTRDGNMNAASREGNIAGIKRAEKSDASVVGTNQGKKAGMDRAIVTGRIDGEALGEKETISKFESTPLTEVKLDGPFAGSFSRRSPAYPGDFNGPNFKPDIWINKEVLKRAYADGYVYIYRDQTHRAFDNRIDGEYNRIYDQKYSENYQIAINRDYPDYYNSGRADGDKRAYDRDYPVIKNNFYRDFYARFDQNPNRNSNEFKSTYASVEASSFASKYEEIRGQFFTKFELETFNANIKEQTEIFRTKRIAEVTKIFNSNAILDFQNSSILDGGTSNVGKFDGVFMPGESTLHNLVIKNYGFKSHDGVRVKLDNGKEVSLPSIPARSIVTIVGAGSSQINSASPVNSMAKTSLTVLASLTSDDAVEAIHFDSMGEGILKRNDQKAVKVSYPFALTNLSLNGQLLKKIPNSLKINVSNLSSRPYVGEMKVELVTSSGNNIISKEFAPTTKLSNGETISLSDAEVLISADADIYRDLAINAKIKMNGVLIGFLPSDLIVMAKAAYEEKAKLPVIAVDSTQSIDALLDLIADFGGSENVSILDTSLGNLNANILANGLSQKAMIVLDNEQSGMTSKLNGFFTKSKNLGVLLVNQNGNGLSVLSGLSVAKDAQKLNLDKRQLMITNPYRADGLQVSSIFSVGKLDTAASLVGLLSTMATTSAEHLAILKKEINRNSFFTANDSLKLFSLRAMAEVMNINVAYDKSGSIFSRDKKWADKISDDQALFINQVKAASNGQVTEDKLGAVLSALAVKDFISVAMSDYFDISRNMMPKILNATNKVLGNLEDGFKKSLKDFNKDLYNKAYANTSIQRPFYIEPKPQPN